MENFSDFMADDIIIVNEDALSDAMSDFIIGLDDKILDALDPEQTDIYEEIVIAAALDGEDLEEGEELEEELWGVITIKQAKSILKKNQMKDAFSLDDKEAAPLLKKKFIVVNKSTRNVGKGKTYSITDAGKNFIESVEMDEAMPAKRVRRDIEQKRKASREHRKVKAKKKIEGRRKRKTASFKRFKKKAKRLGKRGLTGTGKRKRTFINK